MALTNPWVRYIDRTYQQIKDRVITTLQYFVPEITDHTESNLWIKMIGIWAGLTEHLNYYIDNAAREVFLSTMRQRVSALKMAAAFDYRVKSANAASVDLTLYLNEPSVQSVIIPINTMFATADGIPFRSVTSSNILAGSTEGITQAVQQTSSLSATLGVSTGVANQRYVIGRNVADHYVDVSVGPLRWEFVDSFVYSGPNSLHFSTVSNEFEETVVVFGDGINGQIPQAGSNIAVEYFETQGSAGNLAENSIQTITTSLNLPNGLSGNPVILTVTNLGRSSGGTDIESLADLQKNIPLSIKTLSRAVTFDDYRSIAMLVPGVKDARVAFNCGKTVNVYVIPAGGGTAAQELLDRVRAAFYDETRMVTTEVAVLPASEVQLLLDITVTALRSFSRVAVEATIRNDVMAYINDGLREIGGSLEIGNLYEVMEASQGVDFSKINSLNVIPFPRIMYGTNALVTQIELLPASQAVNRWTLQFSMAGDFVLQKNGLFAGIYQINTWIEKEEFRARLFPGSYDAGDTWEFYTYVYGDSIQLQEVAVFRLSNDNFTVKMLGGI